MTWRMAGCAGAVVVLAAIVAPAAVAQDGVELVYEGWQRLPRADRCEQPRARARAVPVRVLVVAWVVVTGRFVAGAAVLVALAVRRRSAWMWIGVAWLAVATVALPTALIAVSGDGAIRSC